MSFSILVSSGYMPRSGITGSYGGFIPSFLKESPYCLPWASLVAQMVKNLPAMQETQVQSLSQKNPLK